MSLMLEFLVNDKASPEIKRLQAQLKQLKPRINEVDKGFLGLNKSMLGLASGIAIVYSMNKAISFAVDEFIKLENAQIGVRKTTGLSEDAFNELNNQLKEMSTTMAGLTPESLYDIAEAAGQLGIQGADDIAEFTRVIGMVGLTTELSAKESATAFAKLSNSLNEPIGKIEILASVANELSNTTSATVGDLLMFSQRLSGGAKTAGLMTDEIFGLSATMADLAIRFETGGTNVNRVMLELISDSDKFAEAMQINAEEYAESVQDKPIEALQTLLEHLGALSKTDAANFLENIGFKGTEVKDVLLKLSSNTALLTKNLKIASDEYKTGTSILNEYKVASEGLEAQNTKLDASFTLLAADIGSKFKEPILEASKSLQDIVDGIRNSEEALGDFIYAITTPIAGIHLFLTSIQVAFNTVPVYFELATIGMSKIWNRTLLEFQLSARNVLPEMFADTLGFSDENIQKSKKSINDITQEQIELSLEVINYQKRLEDVANAYLNIKKVGVEATEEINDETNNALSNTNKELIEIKKSLTTIANLSSGGFSSILAPDAQSDADFKKMVDERQKYWDKNLKEQEKDSKQMWENIGDIAKSNIVGALQAGMDGELDMTSFISQLSKSIGQAMLLSGNIVAGLGAMAFGSLLGGGEDRETSAERAKEELDTFLDGLNSASKALEQFGNVGSSIENQITSLQSEIIKWEGALAFSKDALAEADKKFIKDAWRDAIASQEATIVSLRDEISRVISSSLADTLDISALSMSQLEELTAGIDVDTMKALETELNDLALAAKVGGLGFEDTEEGIQNTADALAILINPDFIKFKDFEEAFDLLAESVSDATAKVNDAMLGSLSYLTDIEKLSYANNIYQSAITPEDRVTSSRQIAEISMGTTRTKEDYIPAFNQFVNELKRQGAEATTQDVVDKLDEVIIAIDASTDSATEDAKYA